MKTKKCWKCKKEIQKHEKICSNCNAKQYLWFKKFLIVIIILFILLFIIAIFSTLDSTMKLPHGELLEFIESCKEYDENNNCQQNIAIIKARIKSSNSNKNTIDQNYYNIAYFIRNYEGTKYEEIQYWAVSKTKTGDEYKVISFTIPRNIIEKIINNSINDNQLGDYVKDLYINQNLKE